MSNTISLQQLQKEILEKVEKIKGEEPENKEEVVDNNGSMKLTAMMVDIKDEKQEETVYTQKKPDPELSLRVRRHTDRIRNIESCIGSIEREICLT